MSDCEICKRYCYCGLETKDKKEDCFLVDPTEEYRRSVEQEKEKGYWANICAMQKRQTEKGIKTYGQTLEQNTNLSMIERLEYLEEELIDGLMYIEHIKAKLNWGA